MNLIFIKVQFILVIEKTVPWSQEHPQCMNNQHHLNDVYVQMIGQCMGGKESFLESENKIMKKIAKSVIIEK
jgi:hypothetical protein